MSVFCLVFEIEQTAYGCGRQGPPGCRRSCRRRETNQARRRDGRAPNTSTPRRSIGRTAGASSGRGATKQQRRSKKQQRVLQFHMYETPNSPAAVFILAVVQQLRQDKYLPLALVDRPVSGAGDVHRSPRPPLPEWAPHEAVWIGFPSDPELWLADLKPAEARSPHSRRRSMRAARAKRSGWSRRTTEPPRPRGSCALRRSHRRAVRRHLAARHGTDRRSAAASERRAQGFGFNGWGGKYDLEGDQDIGERFAARRRPRLLQGRLGARRRRHRRRRIGHRADDRAMPAQPEPQCPDP